MGIIITHIPGRVAKPRYQPVTKTVVAGRAYTAWCPACGDFVIFLEDELKPDRRQTCRHCQAVFVLELPVCEPTTTTERSL